MSGTYSDACEYVFSNWPWCATDCVLWAELVQLHSSLQKALDTDFAAVRDVQLRLLPAQCPKTLNCVKIEPHTGSCSGLHIRDRKGKLLLFDSRKM